MVRKNQNRKKNNGDILRKKKIPHAAVKENLLVCFARGLKGESPCYLVVFRKSAFLPERLKKVFSRETKKDEEEVKRGGMKFGRRRSGNRLCDLRLWA